MLKQFKQAQVQAKQPASVSRQTGVDVGGALTTVWNVSGGQVVGAGKGVVEGVVGAGWGTLQFGWETGWWTYHSSVAYVFDRSSFDTQWDTNLTVGGYAVSHPLDTVLTVGGGVLGPSIDKISHGNVGEAFGELGGQALFFGGVGKLISIAKGAKALDAAADLARATGTTTTSAGLWLSQDIAVSPVAPRALVFERSIGRTSHNRAIQEEIAGLPRAAADIRVNQQQVNAMGQRVGINRPDLQYTLNGQRF